MKGHKISETNRPFKKYLPVQIENINCFCFIDSGNTLHNAISETFANQLKVNLIPYKNDRAGTAKSGSKLNILGQVKRELKMTATSERGEKVTFKIQPLVIKHLSMDINLSGQFLMEKGIDQLHSRGVLRLGTHHFKLTSKPRHEFCREETASIPVISEKSFPVYSGNYVVEIQPMEGKIVRLETKQQDRESLNVGPAEFEFLDSFLLSHKLNRDMSDRSFMEIENTNQLLDLKGDKTLEIYLVNSTENPITISAKTKVGIIYPAILELDVIGSVSRVEREKEKGERWNSNDASRTLNSEQYKKRTEFIEQAFELASNGNLKRNAALKQSIINLAHRNWNVISRPGNPGKTTLIEHPIYVPKHVAPIKVKNRPINPTLMENLREQIAEWLRDGVIRECGVSPWNFPVSPVLKKNGKVRWVVDFRLLNKITRKDSYPIPNITELLSYTKGSKVFSTIDLASAFHAVPVRKEDQEKLTFSTDDRYYSFRMMPFGICSAPNTWARLITKVLARFSKKAVITFFDDILIHTSTVEEHLEVLTKVIETLRKAGLRISAEKSKLFQKECEYLGHVVSEEGISIPDRYTKIIRDWPLPDTMKKLRGWFGKINYYRRFMATYYKVAEPLLKYLKSDGPITSSRQESQRKLPIADDPEAVKAFNELKEALLSSKVLAHPDFNSPNPFIVDSDFCGTGIGFVLSQIQKKIERPIAFGAKKLTKGQLGYGSHKGEMLAAVCAIEHFRYYLMGRKFVLRTDNNALTWLRQQKQPKGVLLRWLRTLSTFDFLTIHRSGKKHQNADSLSRADHAPALTQREIEELQLEENIATLNDITEELDDTELRRCQADDPILCKVISWVKRNEKPTGQEYKSLDPDFKAYVNVFEQLFIDRRGILMKQADPYGDDVRPLYCLPTSLQDKAIAIVHNLAHAGENSTIYVLQNRFFFPRPTVVVKDFVSRCYRCQQGRRKLPQKHTFESDESGYPGDKISIDFVGPLTTTESGNKYLMTILDCFTRWFEAYPCKDQKAETASRFLVEHYIPNHGFPSSCLSDNGPAFISKVFRETLKRFGIRSITTPTYNPKSNRVERFHRTMNTRLKAIIHDRGGEWDEHVPAVLLSMRTSRHRLAKHTPFYLEHGREARLPVDVAVGNSPSTEMSQDDYVRDIQKKFHRAFDEVRNEQKAYIHRQRDLYINSEKKIVVGDLVWLWTPRARKNLPKKFQSFWTGPYVVVRQISNVIFEIESHGDWSEKVVRTVAAVDRLKHCKPGKDEEIPRVQLNEAELRPLDAYSEEIPPDQEFPNFRIEPRISPGEEEKSSDEEEDSHGYHYPAPTEFPSPLSYPFDLNFQQKGPPTQPSQVAQNGNSPTAAAQEEGAEQAQNASDTRARADTTSADTTAATTRLGDPLHSSTPTKKEESSDETASNTKDQSTGLMLPPISEEAEGEEQELPNAQKPVVPQPKGAKTKSRMPTRTISCTTCRQAPYLYGPKIDHCQQHCSTCKNKGTCANHCRPCLKGRDCPRHCPSCSRGQVCAKHKRGLPICKSCTSTRPCAQHRKNN